MSSPDAAVVSLLARLVEERLGLRFAEGDLPALHERLGAGAGSAGSLSLIDYYYRLREQPAGGSAWRALADHLVVGETYFFRELGPLVSVVDELLPPRLAAGQTARLWCAGCATGEEPLTVAMLLAERRLLAQVEIVATDVSQAALARARTGHYPAHALRAPAVPEDAGGFIVRQPDGSLDVAPALVEHVRWRELNLLDAAAARALGTFDVVLCRNVLIYFSDRATRAVVATLGEALAPGGLLLVGVSESLQRFSPALVCEQRQGTFYYRKA